MKTYICHKTVKAAKITDIVPLDGINGDKVAIELEGEKIGLHVGRDWTIKHEPEVGGYFVEYEDGYTSYSPAKAFEDGYSEVAEEF